jgi:hypothetical protein
MSATMKIAFVVAVTFFLIASCAPSRFVKPLKAKEQAAYVSFGGPVIKFSGAPVPIPFTTAGYAYGLSNIATGFVSIHPTSMLFGNIQGDAGATINFLQNETLFGISASPAIQFATHPSEKNSSRMWPSLDLNAYMHTGKNKAYIYAGAGSWLELSARRAHGERRSRSLVPAVHAGYTSGGEKWLHQVEVKYLAPGIPTLPGVVDYIGVNRNGAFGIYYSLIRQLR